MSTGLLNSAISGIHAAQISLQTTEHNISNQNTPGFNRQRIIQVNNVALLTGAGYLGQGAHVSTVERMYDEFLVNQVNRAQTTSSELDAYYAQISQIDNMLADTNSGLSPALQDFFSGVQQVAANPAQLPARQAMLSAAEALVARYRGLEDRLGKMYEDVNSRLVTQVDAVNSYARQIAELNHSIILAEASINQPPNDLLDQRDQLIYELNKLVRVTTTTNTDGSFNVFFGTGQQLVVGAQVMTMTATPSVSDPTRYAVGLTGGAARQELPESLITGGSIGGLLRFRSEALDRTRNDLGRSAASLAITFNAQHALGQDLLGQTMGDANFVADFFTISPPKVIANSRNTSSAELTASFLTNGRYDLSYDGTTYTLTRSSDGTSWSDPTLAGLQDKIPGSTTGRNVQGSGNITQFDFSGAALAQFNVSDGTITAPITLSADYGSVDGLAAAIQEKIRAAGGGLANVTVTNNSGTLTFNNVGSTTPLSVTSVDVNGIAANFSASAGISGGASEGLNVIGINVPAGSSVTVFNDSANGASIDGTYALALNNSGIYSLTRQSDGKVWSANSLATLQATVQAALPASERLILTGASVNPGSATQVYSSVANGANFYTKLTNSDYRLAYDGTNYTVTRLTDGKQWSSSTTAPVKSLAQLSAEVAGSEGFSFSLSGTMNAGESFVIKPVAEVARNIALNPVVAGDARLIAAAAPIRTASVASNTGTGKISAGQTFSGFGLPAFPAGGVTVSYAGASGLLTLTGIPAGANVSVTNGGQTTVYSGAPLNVPYVSGAKISFAGVGFEITGNLADGDSFLIGKNAGGVSDARNALLLGQLQTQNTQSGKTATYQMAYAQMVSDVGNKTRQISVTGEAQLSLLKQSQAAREGMSGVNIDEEAANLIRYQQAYQAAAKAMQIATSLFDTLLAIKS